MSKFSIGQHGIEIETKEKTNVMTSAISIFYIVSGVGVICLIFGLSWVKYFGAAIISFCLIVYFIIFISHSIKNPELLQSERYRLERHRIEAGMIEDKKNKISNISSIETNSKDTFLETDSEETL